MTSKKNTPSSRPYRAYLVRCWQEGGNWRFSLETVGWEPERHGFSEFQELADYLEAQLTIQDSDVSRQI